MRTGFGISWTAVKTMVERGLPLVILFTLLGLTTLLAAVAVRGTPTLQLAVAMVGVLLWFGAAVIALNVLIDSSTEIELSSMYVTDYHGIVWTTANLLAGKLVVDGLFLLLSAPLWLPFFTGDAVPLSAMLQPATLTLSQVYILVVQAAAGLATVYAALRVFLFPAFIAVESEGMIAAFRRSITATQGNADRLLLPLLAAATGAVGMVMLGSSVLPAAAALAAQHLPAPYGPAAIGGGVFLLFMSTGTVFVLAVIASGYSAVT